MGSNTKVRVTAQDLAQMERRQQAFLFAVVVLEIVAHPKVAFKVKKKMKIVANIAWMIATIRKSRLSTSMKMNSSRRTTKSKCQKN